MTGPLFKRLPDGTFAEAFIRRSDGTYAPARADEAECCCGDIGPVETCYAQMTPCSCPSSGVVYYIRTSLLYREGRIWPVYKIAGVCYQVLGTLATDNPPPGWLPVPGYTGESDITGWYPSCSVSACVVPNCPCPTGTERITLSRPLCTPAQYAQVCARYVLIQIAWSGQSIQTDIIRRAGCPTIRPQTIKRTSVTGWILYDFVLNTAADAEFTISGFGSKNQLGSSGGCQTIVGNAIYDRTQTANETTTIGGPFGLAAWINLTGQSNMTGNVMAALVNLAGPTLLPDTGLSSDESFARPDPPASVDIGSTAPTCTGFSGTYTDGAGYNSQWAWGYTAGGYTSNASYTLSRTDVEGSGSVSMSQSWAFYTSRPTTPPTERLCGRFLEFTACDGSGDTRGVDTLLAGFDATGESVAVFDEDGENRCYRKTTVNTDTGDTPVAMVGSCNDLQCGGDGAVEVRPTYAIPDDFDPETEARRIRAGGCCGQPGG